MLTVICASSGRPLAGAAVELDRKCRFAGGVSVRQIVDFLADRRDFVVEQTKRIARKPGKLLCGGNRDFA